VQTAVTTVSTASTTSIGTATTLSTTTSSGTVDVSQTDTFNVLVTRILKELRQFADEVLEVLGVQRVSTPVGEQVNRVVVTVPNTVHVNLHLATYKSVNVNVEVLQGSTIVGMRRVTLTYAEPDPSLNLSNLPGGSLTVRISGYSIATQTQIVPRSQTVTFYIL